MASAAEQDVFDVVVICSGNRFRSPIAQTVLQEASAGLPVRVGSAGTLDLQPGPALPQAITIGKSLGLDLSAHVSRRVAGSDLSEADLVIGFEPIHVATAVVDAGARRERTFLLTELMELLSGVGLPNDAKPVERARSAVREANEARSRVPTGDWGEIADPVGGPEAGFVATGRLVRQLTLALAASLFGPRSN